jgi:hypothetical protein
MADTPSKLYRLVEERLDGTLADFIAARRPHQSWRRIAAELDECTGIGVSWESLRLWFADRITVRTEVTVR